MELKRKLTSFFQFASIGLIESANELRSEIRRSKLQKVSKATKVLRKKKKKKRQMKKASKGRK